MPVGIPFQNSDLLIGFFNTLTSTKSIQYLYNPNIFSKILELCVKLN
jgi:hypothetical protein